MKTIGRKHEHGAGLFIVIIIAAGLAAIGITLVSLTSMGPKIAGGMRSQEEAFNAAEAGFEAARSAIENSLSLGTWPNFAGRYLVQPTGIDLPFISGAANAAYFRRQTDAELLASFDTNGDGTPDVANLLFFNQTFALDETGQTDARLTATAFLINKQAGGGGNDANTALLVVIGAVRAGTRILATTRLEIELSCQGQGT
jgi:hypothetical protein